MLKPILSLLAFVVLLAGCEETMGGAWGEGTKASDSQDHDDDDGGGDY